MEMNKKKTAILAEIPGLRRFARALLRYKDAADDLVQDSLERALMRLDNRRTGDNPHRWLITIIHYLFADRMRKVNLHGGAFALPAEAVERVTASYSQLAVLRSGTSSMRWKRSAQSAAQQSSWLRSKGSFMPKRQKSLAYLPEP